VAKVTMKRAGYTANKIFYPMYHFVLHDSVGLFNYLNQSRAIFDGMLSNQKLLYYRENAELTRN